MRTFAPRRRSVAAAAVGVLLLVPGARARPRAPDRESPITEASIRGHMEMLASDALRGRGSGTHDELVAATYIASQLTRWGLEPLGDDGTYIQSVVTPRGARSGPVDAGPGHTWNVLARIRGRDPERAAQVILLSAHLDHLGVRGSGPDTIYNGADDDASGSTAVLEYAEAFARGARPARSLMFAWFGSEEAGGYGARHFLDEPPVPLSSIVANLEFEMIGRPDMLVPPRDVWLTGYERTTLGPALADHGALIVPDPRPAERFFFRSDNIQLAEAGVVAQTVSSYGMYAQYHTPADNLAHIDFDHMTAVVQSLLPSIRWLANSTFTPIWRPGQQPSSH